MIEINHKAILIWLVTSIKNHVEILVDYKKKQRFDFENKSMHCVGVGAPDSKLNHLLIELGYRDFNPIGIHARFGPDRLYEYIQVSNSVLVEALKTYLETLESTYSTQVCLMLDSMACSYTESEVAKEKWLSEIRDQCNAIFLSKKEKEERA